ncbi:MAG: LLM class flavin-dependent oxidoreductase [Chloroflexota bacterium]
MRDSPAPPVRFCAEFTHHAWTRGDPAAAPAATLAAAAAADAAGIDAIWVNEDPEGWDAFAVLGAIAARTSGAWLGPSVTNPYLRHPNLTAASVATLDRLSGGRAVLGLGRGQPEWYERGLGMARGAPFARLEETVALVRAWQDAAGGHRVAAPADAEFPVRGWERQLHPLRPFPPVLVAAAGPRALALAGRLADGAIFNGLTSDEALAAMIPAVRAAAAVAGRDPSRLWFVLRTAATVTADPEAVLRREKTLFALVNALPGMDALVHAPGYDVAGLLAEVRRALRTDHLLAEGRAFPDLRRGDLAAARAAIPDGLIHRLAMAGDAAFVRRRIAAVAALGVTHVTLAAPAEAADPAAWRAALATLRPD